MRKGFTLIETIIVISIIITLLGSIMAVSLNFRPSTLINSNITTFLTDLKNQQMKAMTGDTEGRGVPDTYGIYFQTNNYTLFHGSVYSAGNPDNFVIPLDSQLQFSDTLPNHTLLFTAQSGEITGFVSNQNTVTISDAAGELSKTISLNKYGSVINIQ